MITQSDLKEIFDYDTETGLFKWKAPGPGRRKTSIAGNLHPSGYIILFILGQKYLAHRMAWLYETGNLPEEDIDHINHIRNDNKWANLREATRSENCRNASLSKLNKSGVTGVFFRKLDKRWAASICVRGKQTYLGQFIDFDDAVDARRSAEVKYGFHENHGRIK